MYYVESENFLSKQNIDFIEKTILNNNFPYKYRTQCVPGDGNSFLVHNVLDRPEHRANAQSKQTPYLEDVCQILISFCRKNNIKLKEILRAAINFTYNNGKDKSPAHVDHDYPHKQLIVYLNDCDKKAHTVILDNNNKILKKIRPKKYKGVCFEALPHYAIFPKKGHRVIGVFTFR